MWDYCSWLFFVLGALVFSLLVCVDGSPIFALFPAPGSFSFPALFSCQTRSFAFPWNILIALF